MVNLSPEVSIVMGSKSDMLIMEQAGNLLEELGVSCEIKVCSAHRLPEETAEYAKSLEQRGIQVVIAGAGMAAHLPGVIAAYTLIPVIGVPLSSKVLDGIDSLYSIVQMPTGIPVATVAINGSKNAALLACEILALRNSHVKKSLKKYRDDMKDKLRVILKEY